MSRKTRSLLSMYAMLAATGFDNDYGTFIDEKPIKKPKKIIRPKNHKEFFYGENSVWALSKKRADIKARKKGYL